VVVRRRVVARPSPPERPSCCPRPWSPNSADALDLDGAMADLSDACPHTLAELDRRTAHWEAMRPDDRPWMYPPLPMRRLINARRAGER
jgi:hypothetical protein